MNVVMAEHFGMCFGVVDAIELTLKLAERGPLTILGDLVHNPDVVAQMEAAGAGRTRDAAAVATDLVVLTAHGTSDKVKADLRAAGREVHDAACPLVTRAHLALRKLVAENRFPVVVGKRDHVEVLGMVGDLDDVAVVGAVDEIDGLAGRERLGIVAQTTQPLEFVQEIVAAIRARFPAADVKFVDTVCQPTKDRQESLRQLARTCDVVVVVGGPESNNSKKLVELARQLGRPAYLVNAPEELRAEWFAGCETVGLTAGTSTPEQTIAAVRRRLEGMNQSPSRAA